MNTGHEGSLTTVHANSTVDALSRLETLASMSDVSLPVDTIRDQINGAIDVIVQLERDATGARRVSEISEVTSERRDPYVTQPIMRSLVGIPNTEKDSVARFSLSERLEHRLTQRQEQVIPVFFGNSGGTQ